MEPVNYASARTCEYLAKAKIKPDTKLSYYEVVKDSSGKHKPGDYIAVSKAEAVRLRMDGWAKGQYKFYAPVYTEAYATEAGNAYENYEAIKHKTTNMRYDNWNYSTTPMEKAKEVLDKYLTSQDLLRERY